MIAWKTGKPSKPSGSRHALRIELPRDPGAAASGRNSLARFLGARGWGARGSDGGDRCDGTGKTALDDAILMTNELITNAIKHGAGVIAMSVDYDECETLSVAVEDEGVFPLAPAGFESGNIRVRGLGLVAKLADRWGIESGPRTRVWFELALS